MSASTTANGETGSHTPRPRIRPPARLGRGILPVAKYFAAIAAAALLLIGVGCQREPPSLNPLFKVAVYVASSSGEIRVLDGLNFSLIARLRVGGRPSGLIFNPARNEVYAIGSDSHYLTVIDVNTASVVARIRLPEIPSAIFLTGQHSEALLPAGANHGMLIRVDLPSRTVVTTLRLGRHPSAVAVDATGRTAIVADEGDNAVSIVDLQAWSVLATVPVGGQPVKIIALPYGSKAFVLCPGSNEISVLDLKSHALITDLPVGPDPADMVLKPDGGEIYVSNNGGATVNAIDTSANQISGTMLAGSHPVGLYVYDPPNHADVLYVANAGSNSVSMIRVDDRKVIANVSVGETPFELRGGPFGRYLFVEDRGSNDVGVIATDVNSATPAPALLTVLPTPPSPTALAVVSYRRTQTPVRQK
jgi:YVTN family beta-propeller protein